MGAEGNGPPDRVAVLDVNIERLESALADFDEAGLDRIALPVNEALELARAARLLIDYGARAD